MEREKGRLECLMKRYHETIDKEGRMGILGQVSVNYDWEGWMDYYNSLTEEEISECVRPPDVPFSCTDATGLSNVQRVDKDLKKQYYGCIDEWEGTGLGQGYVDRAWTTWNNTYRLLTKEEKDECTRPDTPFVIHDYGRKHSPYAFA